MAFPSWRPIRWLLLIGWVPVLLEAGCAHIPHFEERFPSTILIIPYVEFITMPLTVLAIGFALYKASPEVSICTDARTNRNEPWCNRQLTTPK